MVEILYNDLKSPCGTLDSNMSVHKIVELIQPVNYPKGVF
jgi:hypothetical protein